jgi:hypothetical protein
MQLVSPLWSMFLQYSPTSLHILVAYLAIIVPDCVATTPAMSTIPPFLSAITIDTSSAYLYMTTWHQQARVKWSLLTASTDMCTNFGGSQDNLQSHLKFNIQVARDTKSTTPHISGISSQTRQRQLAKFLAQRHDVITLLTNHSKTWACHDILSCDGLILILGFTC